MSINQHVFSLSSIRVIKLSSTRWHVINEMPDLPRYINLIFLMHGRSETMNEKTSLRWRNEIVSFPLKIIKNTQRNIYQSRKEHEKFSLLSRPWKNLKFTFLIQFLSQRFFLSLQDNLIFWRCGKTYDWTVQYFENASSFRNMHFCFNTNMLTKRDKLRPTSRHLFYKIWTILSTAGLKAARLTVKDFTGRDRKDKRAREKGKKRKD